MKYILVVVAECLHTIVFMLPRFRSFNWIKSKYLFLVAKSSIGMRPVFYSGVRIFSGKNLIVGDDVDFAKGVLVTTDGGVTIGDRVLIGYGTMIFSSNHAIPDRKQRIFYSGHIRKPVVIENDVWIGAGCIVLPGVRISEGAVIAAASVVTKNVAAFSVVAGNPARKIRER